jgi:hypothetical protein
LSIYRMTESKEKSDDIDKISRVRVKWGTTCIDAQNGKANTNKKIARVELR